MDVYRITKVEDVDRIEPLLEDFHEKQPMMRYNLQWTLGAIRMAVLQKANSYVLVAHDPERGYMGYIWGSVNPSGELFIVQALSKTPATGKALHDGLLYYSQKVGIRIWDGLVNLEPGEPAQLLQSMRRFKRLCDRFQCGPKAIFLSKVVGTGH